MNALVGDISGEVRSNLQSALLPEGRAGDSSEVGLMRLCGHAVALPAAAVREVVPQPDRLEPLFCGGRAAGAVVVRERIIPVVDLADLLGFSSGHIATSNAEPPAHNRPAGGVVVILRRGESLLGLLMDSVSGLAHLAKGALQICEAPDAQVPQLVRRTFLHGSEVVSLIDPAAVFALDGIPHAREIIHDADASTGVRKPVVLLSVAGVEIACDASRVLATAPNAALRPSPVPSSVWAGVVQHLGREVPVIDDVALLGLSGRAGATGSEPVVILRGEGDHLLGLKIDHIRRLLQVREADIRPLPAAVSDRLDLFRGAIVDAEGRESLLLSDDALSRSQQLQTVAALSRATGFEGACSPHGIASSKRSPTGSTGAKGDHSPGSHRYLVFRVGERHRAAPLTSVTQIIPFPNSVRPLDAPGSSLIGIGSLGGRPLPLVDLGGDGAPRNGDFARSVVLVVDVEGSVTGCVADALEAVVEAVPMAQPGGDSIRNSFIEAKIGGAASAVTIWDLSEQARLRS